MKVRDRVLGALEEHRGDYLSGETLAKDLSVSRNAVWKAVRQLQEQGHEIDAVPNRGYCLSAGSNLLTIQGITRHLTAPDLQLHIYPELLSTNLTLKQLAEEGAPEGTVVIAESQSQGKGRRGHSFYSPPGGGIYMSLLLRPPFSAQDALCITTCAAVSVCRAIETLSGRDTQIKWVNDVFIDGKKVCGISTEAALDLEGGGLHYAILGIGINVFPGKDPIPAELRDVITTVFDKAVPGTDMRSRLIASVLNHFMAEYPTLTEKGYFEEYRSRSMVLGKPIYILRGDRREPAAAIDLEPDFRLQVRKPDGQTELLSSGEVSIRLSDKV